MLWQRLLFGALLIAALIGLIRADDWLSSQAGLETVGRVDDGLVVVVILAALSALGVRELGRLVRAAGHAPLAAWAGLICVFLIAIPFLVVNHRWPCCCFVNAGVNDLTVGAILVAFLGTALIVSCRRHTDGVISDIGATLLMILYLGLLPQYLVRIRMFGPPGAVWLLLYFVGTVKFCDIGAYFTGLAIGRHKLIVWLSPKKTWEGLIGGLATSAGVAMLVSYLVRTHSTPLTPLASTFPELPTAALFGLLMGLVGQGGDLLESLFKRGAQAKDSANAIPAFGGVLDVIDSLLPTAPLAYWMLLQ